MHTRKRLSFGPLSVPPRPGGVAMTDRTDGTDYYLTDDGAGALSVTAKPSNWGDFTYGANHGPIMSTPDGNIRLFLSSGVLDYDNYDGDTTDAPIHTRRAGSTPTIYELTAPSDFKRGDAASTFTLVDVSS